MLFYRSTVVESNNLLDKESDITISNVIEQPPTPSNFTNEINATKHKPNPILVDETVANNDVSSNQKYICSKEGCDLEMHERCFECSVLLEKSDSIGVGFCEAHLPHTEHGADIIRLSSSVIGRSTIDLSTDDPVPQEIIVLEEVYSNESEPMISAHIPSVSEENEEYYKRFESLQENNHSVSTQSLIKKTAEISLLYEKKTFEWCFDDIPEAVNIVWINDAQYVYEPRTFDLTKSVSKDNKIYYDPHPLNVSWMIPLYNWLVMAAVKKRRPNRVILSRCALVDIEGNFDL